MISKKAKAAYDKKYRRKNAARIKAAKAAYFQRTYDPVKAAEERKNSQKAGTAKGSVSEHEDHAVSETRVRSLRA